MERDSRKRAEALLAQMTATEKVGQLNQHLYGFRIYHVEDGKIIFTQELKDEVKKWGGIGTIYGLYRADPWSEKNYETGLAGGLSMQAYNQLQKYVIEHSRLGIPFLLSSECPHGHQALDGYLLPVNLAVGASFDPALYERAGQVCGRQLKQMGVDFALVSAHGNFKRPKMGAQLRSVPWGGSIFTGRARAGDRNRNPERGRCSGCKTLLCTGGDDRRGQCQRSADRREGTVGDPFTGGEGML